MDRGRIAASLAAILGAALLPTAALTIAASARPTPRLQAQTPSESLVDVVDEAVKSTAVGVDFTGEWAPRFHEDEPERVPGPELGDYLGIPISDAARLRAMTWEASVQTLPEWQCRPHPSPNAPHTWAGFSPGKWDGDVLTITTTHLKEGYLRRNGLPRSDVATLTEHWMLRGDVLTVAAIVTDPVYLTEPFIRTTDYELDLHQQVPPYPCQVVEEVDRPRGVVPNRLPGTNPYLHEFADGYGLPFEATEGGAVTMYPDYVDTLRTLMRGSLRILKAPDSSRR